MEFEKVDVPGWPNVQVDCYGNVYAMNFKFGRQMKIKPSKTKLGYLRVKIDGHEEYVHRLVCLAFHGEPKSNDLEVAHYDDVKDNNIPSNLRWATHQDNVLDRYRCKG